MIGIKVNGQFLKLFPDTRIQLKLNNPMFNESGKVPGIYTIPFEVPNDELGYNASLLGAADLVENADDVVGTEKPATVYFDGAPLYTGVVKVEPTEDDKLQVTFLAGLRSVAEDFKDVKLKNLSWPVTELHSINYGQEDNAEVTTESLAQSIIDQAMPKLNTALANGDFKLHAIINPSFSNADGYIGMVNYLNSSQQPFANKKLVKKSYEWITNLVDRQFSPFPGYIGTMSLQIDGTTYSATYTGSPATYVYVFYRNLVDQVNAIDNGETVYAQLTYQNDGPVDAQGVAGVWIDVFFLVDFDTPVASAHNRLSLSADWQERTGNLQVSYQNRYYYVPTYRFQQVFDQISEDYGVIFKGDFFEDTDLQQLHFYANKSLNLPITITTGDNISGEEFLGIVRDYNPGQYMPDWTIKKWINEVSLLFNLAVIYNGNLQSITMNFKENVVRRTGYLDAKSEMIRFAKGNIKPTGATGFTFRYKRDNTLTLPLLDTFNEKIVKTGATPRESNFVPTNISASKRVKIFGDTQTKAYFDEEEGITPPLIFFDGGISDNQQYAFYQRGSYQLYWSFTSDTNTLYTRFHENWTRFLLRRKLVNITALLEYRHLTLVDFEQKVMYDRVKYYYKSIDVTLTMRGIEPAKVELYST